MYYPQQKDRHGLSLIEVAVSSLLVGGLVVGSLNMLGASVRTQTTLNEISVGPILAEQLVAEIMAMPYEDPESGGSSLSLDSGESGLSRKDFDDIDDYNNWDSENVANTQDGIQTKEGTLLTEHVGWTRKVNVWWADKGTGDVAVIWEDSGLKRFRVTVTSPAGVATDCSGVRSRWGILEQPTTVDTIIVTRVEAALTLGTATEARQFTNLLNHVADPNAN